MLKSLAVVALPSGSDVFLGIDVSVISWHVTARCQGETVISVGLAPSVDALRHLLDRLAGCQVRSVYEAGPFGYGLHDWLEAQGVRSMVTSPSNVPLEVGNRIKTDKRDSLKLARTLEAGLLRPVYVPPARYRADRELVRQRDRLQRHRRSAMIRIKALFLSYGVACPFRAAGPWRGPFQRWLAALELPDPVLQEVLAQARDLYFELDRRLTSLDRRLREMARSEPYAALTAQLSTAPGIGPLNALILAVELVDWSRFSSGEALSAFVGLTPSEYSSGARVRHGRITRTGNPRVRTVLVEASWILIRKDPQMRAFYERLRQRRGSKRAIIAVARKLCVRLLAMVRRGESYQPAVA
jgi:transposase